MAFVVTRGIFGNGSLFVVHCKTTKKSLFVNISKSYGVKLLLQIRPTVFRKPNNRKSLVRCLSAEKDVRQYAGSDIVAVGISTCVLLSIVFNRLFTSELSVSQERADLLGVIFSVLSLVHVLWRQDFKIKEDEPEQLVGKYFREIDLSMNHENLLKLENLCCWIQEATYAKSIVIQQGNRTLVRLGPGQEVQQIVLGELAKNCLASGKASFLADLKVVAERNEFYYMPSNCKVSCSYCL